VAGKGEVLHRAAAMVALKCLVFLGKRGGKEESGSTSVVSRGRKRGGSKIPGSGQGRDSSCLRKSGKRRKVEEDMKHHRTLELRLGATHGADRVPTGDETRKKKRLPVSSGMPSGTGYQMPTPERDGGDINIHSGEKLWGIPHNRGETRREEGPPPNAGF